MRDYLSFPIIAIKVLFKSNNWFEYFKDYFGLNKEPWVFESAGRKLKLRPNSVDRWIATENFILDEYELNRFDAQDFDTIIDLGSNIGASVIALAHKFPEAKIFAVEPNPSNFKLLLENIELNGFEDRITAVNAAVTDSDGETVKLYLNQDAAANSTTVASGESLEVKNLNIFKLEQYLGENTLLKMDIEGGEMAFFTDEAFSLLEKFGSVLFEYHNVSEDVNGDLIEKYLINNGVSDYKRNRNFFFIYSLPD